MYFFSLGRLFALALANDIIPGIKLATAFLLQLANEPVELNDIAELDPELHSSLSQLLVMPENEVRFLLSFG